MASDKFTVKKIYDQRSEICKKLCSNTMSVN